MRSFALVLLLISTPVRADVAVGPKTTHAKPSLCPEIIADAGSFPSGDQVELAGFVHVDNGPGFLRTAPLTVRDAAGKVVFVAPRAFVGNDEDPVSVGLGMSSSASPSLPRDLPPGRYDAVWTVDGVDSNRARFTIGPTPPPLVLERVDPPACSHATALYHVHVFNAGPELLELPENYGASVLLVDGKRFEKSGLDWDGSSGLSAGRAWAFSFTPGEYGATLAPGRHTLALQFGKWRSNAIEVVEPAQRPDARSQARQTPR